MTRWLLIALNLVLFAIAMLVVRWLLHATVPDLVQWAISMIGAPALLILMFLTLGSLGVWAYREHRRQALSRRL